jgi:hypothetical protein
MIQPKSTWFISSSSYDNPATANHPGVNSTNPAVPDATARTDNACAFHADPPAFFVTVFPEVETLDSDVQMLTSLQVFGVASAIAVAVGVGVLVTVRVGVLVAEGVGVAVATL